MISLRKSVAFVAVAVSAIAAFSPAQADVMSGAMVNMTNFVVRGSSGSILDAADFGFLTFTSSTGYTVSLSGNADASDSSTVAGTDFAPVCLGGACPVLTDNVFAKLFAPPVAGNYAAMDQFEGGAPVNGITGLTAPAHVANAAYVGLTGTAIGSSVTDNNLQSSMTFVLNQAQGITFAFDVDAYLQASVTSDESFPAFATASYQMDFTLRNLSTGQTVYTFSPDLFAASAGIGGIKTVSLNAPLPFDIEVSNDTGGPIGFSSTTVALNSGTLYQLSARIQTNADAQKVPEPETLSLIGAGMLLAGFARARRKKTAA